MRTIQGTTEFPEKVRLAMVRKRLTITEIASRIGKSKATVSLVLRGKLKARETSQRIARILGIRVSDFVAEKDRRRPGKNRAKPDLHGLEKGSKQALLYALNSPPRCTNEDVDTLLEQISLGTLKTSYADPFRSRKKWE